MLTDDEIKKICMPFGISTVNPDAAVFRFARAIEAHLMQGQIDKLPCGHPSELLVKSVESDHQFCELCECMSMRDDAEAQEAALLVERDELAKKLKGLMQGQQPATSPMMLLKDDLANLSRFNECCEDSESGGHDIDKGDMRRLCEIGAVRSLSFGRHEMTMFGRWVLESKQAVLPLRTLEECNAAPLFTAPPPPPSAP